MPTLRTQSHQDAVLASTENERPVGRFRPPDNPKLAVVISCYNYEVFVGDAIQSVLGQGREDCEIVVVDDGSTDGSWDVIRRSGVPAFKIANGGQVRACLYGLDQTRAPFVLFLDADDELKPGAIGVIIDRLDPQVAKLQFSLTRIDEAGATTGEAHSSLDAFRSREALVRKVLRTGVYKSPPTSGNVFRRDLCELVRKASYDEAIDGVMLFAAPFLGDVVSISEPLGCYRIHRSNKSGLGRAPEVAIFKRDITRFLARMEHLRAIIRPYGRDQELTDPTKVFYFRELSFALTIASGQRPRLREFAGLLHTLVSESFSAKNKLALAAFYLLGSLLPNDKAKALLAYRFGSRRRSMPGFMAEIFAPRTQA